MATSKSAGRGAATLKQSLSSKPAGAKPAIAITDPAAESQNDDATTTPYSQALSRLSPLQPVLLGLAHRNSNQHHRAAWWRYFAMLRRNSARFVDVLSSAAARARRNAARAARAAAKAKSKKRRREALASDGVVMGAEDDLRAGADDEVDAEVARHAVWLRDVLVPKCYLAFTQLTADPQFAPLGVVLLGILGQTQAACDCVAPKAPPSSSDPDVSAEAGDIHSVGVTTVTPTAGGTPILPPKSAIKITSAEPSQEDKKSQSIGKLISRADVERLSSRQNAAKAEETIGTKPEKDTKRAAVTATINLKRASTPLEATSSLLASRRSLALSTRNGGAEEPPAKKVKTAAPEARADVKDRGVVKGSGRDEKSKKKKKKAGKGDEFDDLFKALF
ncbi:hypothetical protein F4777DRAFT_365845 [Nemania sp. FL0916]|nr:hypothetical protein F4777DRAFT_365845 [Nemania sp. FL0916]